MMDIERFPLDGLVLLKPRVFADERGAFMETFSQRRIDEAIGAQRFVQDNESIRAKRAAGLSFQAVPFAGQGKLVRVRAEQPSTSALTFDVTGPTYGQHVKVRLAADATSLLWVPAGFAHGFVAGRRHNIHKMHGAIPAQRRSAPSAGTTPDFGIDWGVSERLVSAKDLRTPFAGPWDPPK
ncbi:MAG: dTDP-4-dehydrorhamnose 3,5-epimerase family protein [Flavobacteriales bacterium]|nr:dTDP-4-dehydrorhamnose 3,5-epimerase family protein [Flavobacteriales bacterium]